MEEKKIKSIHNMIMENRQTLSLTGVMDVDSFDENTIVLFTDYGMLTIKGYDLHITKLSVEIGEVAISGEIYVLEYADQGQKKQSGGGFFSKIFK